MNERKSVVGQNVLWTDMCYVLQCQDLGALAAAACLLLHYL